MSEIFLWLGGFFAGLCVAVWTPDIKRLITSRRQSND